MAARRFLWVIAILVMLVIAGALVWRLFGLQLIRFAVVPGIDFAESPLNPAPDYATDAGWLAKPGKASAANFVPPNFAVAPKPAAALFFVTPTAFIDRSRWNAPLTDDAETAKRLGFSLSGQASAFNGIAAVWSPRYRQATFGTFLADAPAQKAPLDVAYGDVARAFDAFVAAIPADMPIFLAGHSQGSVHLIRLMKEKVAGTPLAARVVAAYPVGWPVSLGSDIPKMGLPACTAAGQPGCVLSWQTFAEPAETDYMVEAYNADPARKGTKMLCSNPLTGRPDSAAPETANMGALVIEGDKPGGTLLPNAVPARCDAEGFLLIGPPQDGFGTYVMPGGNTHFYDFHMFWANVRADAEARLSGHAARTVR
jgi:hypothetical protein